MDITNELLAAYAQGNVSVSEREAVRQYLMDHPEELESVMIMMDEDFDIQLDKKGDNVLSRSFDRELDALLDEIDSEEPKAIAPPPINTLPMLQKAAQNVVDNLCAVRCEGYALRALGIDVSDEELEAESEKQGWLKTDGTPLHFIGLLAGRYNLYVVRRYNCTIADIIRAVIKEEIVIAVIDNTELKMPLEEAKRNDIKLGQIPNHAVVIKSVDLDYKQIDIYDPERPNFTKTLPIDVFKNAWDDSYNYLVCISNQSNYEPHPLNLDDVPIEPELLELREAIAENAHEVWAEARKREGWSYGSERDDTKKLHPDMLPYNLLPETEKEYDRQMAMNTIKLVKKLGWEFRKRE